jgi:hypothetical protein
MISSIRYLALCTLPFALATPSGGGEPARHWAFVPPTQPAVPDVADAAWPRNPIDRFILTELEAFDLHPAPEADRATLLRRLRFDLTGLPPTPEEVLAFLADDRPDAYERVVDRLLASPAYGERQAQHWLDLARHADSDGFEFDAVRPDAWRYRDWVVRAFNADLPYDRFVTLQTAGDEVEPGDADAFIATGFNRGYPDMVDLNDQGLRRQNALNDITETTGLVFLGLTIGCARCHDHKADPIPQADFYRLQAFFTPSRFRDDFAVSEADERAEYERRLAGWEAEVAALEGRLRDAPDSEKPRLARSLERLKKDGRPRPPQARGLDEDGGATPPTFLLVRGDFASKGAEVAPGFPTAVATDAPRIEPTGRSTGRRTALARWLTAPENPLTARVMVNRLWQQHFGRGLVATPSDFGTMGEPPSHPELLDWLAVEFIEHDWSLKYLHKMIVTSSTYRQSTRHDESAAETDPENALLAHQARRRLDGEAIRDALLAASGEIQRAMGGPGVFPELPPELAKLNAQGVAWPVSPEARDRNRRSLYVFVRRNLRYPFFEAFDRPDTNASCPRRPSTTIAPQALALLNGGLARDAAQALAARIGAEAGDDADARVERAFLLIVNRPPDDREWQLAREFLAESGRLDDLALALLNASAFLYLD